MDEMKAIWEGRVSGVSSSIDAMITKIRLSTYA